MAAKRRTSRAKRRTSRAKRRTSRAKQRTTRKRISRKRKTVRKRKARKKVSIKGSKIQVFRGTRQKTKSSGQTKADLIKNKRGKICSKKQHKRGLKLYKKNGIEKWTKAFMQARAKLGITGFVACKKGSKLYNETMKLYK